MEIIRGFVYTLYPTEAQRRALAQTAGVVRLVYNLALEQRRVWGGRPSGGGPYRGFGAKSLSGELSDLRKSVEWIGAVSQTAQNQALIDLDRAFTNFFEGRAGFPSPRKRGRNDAFRHVGREVSVRRLNAKWSEVRVPKTGWVRFRDTRPLPPGAEIRNATLRAAPGGRWEISISVRYEAGVKPTPDATVGVDRGVAIPFALSTGEVIRLPATMSRRDVAIRRARRALSRRKRGSRRYARARARVSRLTAANARTRAHVAHVLSRRLARTAGLVAIEDLRIRSMTASAAGTAEAPGRNVAQKSGLNRAILNVGWHMFERVLSYKMEEYGGVLVKVKPHHSSQECAKCHHVDARSRESQAVFVCVACGEAANADVNAACVIASRALALDEYRRWNTPSLDVEGKASAPDEASTHTGNLPIFNGVHP